MLTRRSFAAAIPLLLAGPAVAKIMAAESRIVVDPFGVTWEVVKLHPSLTMASVRGDTAKWRHPSEMNNEVTLYSTGHPDWHGPADLPGFRVHRCFFGAYAFAYRMTRLDHIILT